MADEKDQDKLTGRASGYTMQWHFSSHYWFAQISVKYKTTE